MPSRKSLASSVPCAPEVGQCYLRLWLPHDTGLVLIWFRRGHWLSIQAFLSHLPKAFDPFCPVQGDFSAFERTHPCTAINWYRAIHKFDSANNVLSCSVFFFNLL